MADWYTLPEEVAFSKDSYKINGDFRNVLKILRVLQGQYPAYIRWKIAMELFYSPSLSTEDYEAGLAYFLGFVNPGEAGGQGRKLLDWDADAPAIIAGVNAVAGQEVRSLPFVHWWTFLGWFHAIAPGELSMRVSIREKLQKGKKLEPWEQEYYRENKATVDLRPGYSAEELVEKDRLNALLGQ